MSGTVAPLEDRVLKNVDELFESGRKILLHNSMTPQLAEAQGKKLSELHLFSAKEFLGPDLKRMALHASNLNKFCTIGQFDDYHTIMMYRSVALNYFIWIQ